MKICIFGLLVVGLGILAWHAGMIALAMRSCSLTYNTQIAEGSMRLVISGNTPAYCSSSYNAIDAWEACVVEAQKRAPPELAKHLTPLTFFVLRSIGDRSVNLAVVKQEHDVQCKEYVDYMYDPPKPLY